MFDPFLLYSFGGFNVKVKKERLQKWNTGETESLLHVFIDNCLRIVNFSTLIDRVVANKMTFINKSALIKTGLQIIKSTIYWWIKEDILVIHIKSNRGAFCDFDHYLVAVSLCFRLFTVSTTRRLVLMFRCWVRRH